ncbi:MAG: hypothetical protein ABSB19_08805 [Methylomonas sp.]|jgi:hypothetical protein
MKMSRQVEIWNRAALDAGGDDPREGDSALAALLLLHGMAMNGGVDHAIDVLSSEEYAMALAGYRYYGLERVADVLERARDATDAELDLLDTEYSELVPQDETLVQAFRVKLMASPEAFALTGEKPHAHQADAF